jgi:hypothetical protein
MADDPKQGGSSSGEPPYDATSTPEQNLEEVLAARWDPGKLSGFLRASSRSKGQALDYGQRSRFEERLGVDLGHVRVYTGELAEEITRQHNAEALTVGDTGMVLMRQSTAFAPGSAAGQALLAHELTHVAQAKPDAISRKATSRDLALDSVDETEAEAEQVEAEELARATGQSPPEGSSGGEKQQKKEEKKELILAKVLELLEEDARFTLWRLGLDKI